MGGEGPIGFREAIRATGARLVPIGPRIALEAAEVATVYVRKNPGDSLPIATARLCRVPIITRSARAPPSTNQPLPAKRSRG